VVQGGFNKFGRMKAYSVQLLCSQLSKRSNLSSGKWLIFLDPVISLDKFFKDIHIPFDCEFLVAEMLYRDDDEGTEVSLTEVYRVQPTQALQK
jgi:hypothetical protein